MPACARRALVVLFTCIAGVIALVPTASAVSRDVVAAAPHSATAPVTGTKLTLTPHHRTIRYDHRVHLVAQLTGRFRRLKDTKVAVLSRRPGHAWHRVSRPATGKHGKVGWTARLRHTTRWQVRYAGDLLHDPARSTVATIHVLPPPPPPPPAPKSAF